jgi:ATP-dependent RNA helicase DDX52/ROK1
VSASRKKLKKEKKTTEKIIKIKKETENHIRNLNNIHVNGDDIPEATETFEKLFSTFSIPSILQSNLLAYNFQEPTPIQMQAIPALLNVNLCCHYNTVRLCEIEFIFLLINKNREIMACAPTGSGKTIAFLLPILYHLKKPEKKGFRALILAPTRELVQQVSLITIDTEKLSTFPSMFSIPFQRSKSKPKNLI